MLKIEYSSWKIEDFTLRTFTCFPFLGPIMSKFINAFRELASYKELLRSQVSINLPSK